MKRILSTLGAVAVAALLNAQTRADLGHGQATMSEAGTLVGKEKGDEALGKLATIHRSDSLYQRSIMQRVQILLDQEAYSSVEKLCVEGMREGGDLSGAFTVIRTAVLLDMDRDAEALAAADSAIAMLPGNFRSHHLKTLAYIGLKNTGKALEQAMWNARHFPYQRDAHMTLGTIAQGEGRTAQAALALMMAQLIRFEDETAEKLLTYYDGILGGSVEPESEGYDLSVTGDELEDLDLLIRSKVAMDRKYKLKPDLDYPMCRQSHLLFKSIADKKGKLSGFYTSFYGPMAKAIIEEGQFEAFVYHCLTASSSSEVNGAAEKNRSKVTEFRTWIAAKMQEHYLFFPETEGGPELLHHYNDSDDLFGVGPSDRKSGINTGEWTVYHTNGRVSAVGSFDSSGERTGKWTHWAFDGTLDSEGNYKNGQVDGPIVNYHRTGYVMDSTNVRMGKREGLGCSYYSLGGRRSCKVAKDDEWTGPANEYFPSGVVEWSYELVNGNTEGKATQQFVDGAVRFTGDFKADLRTGTFVEFHPNGQKAEEYTYVAGKSEGPFKEWHPSGQLKLEGTMKGGAPIGERRRYDEWGMLRTIDRFGDGGKLQGLREEFNTDGTRTLDMEYTRDLLTRYRYYGSDGSVLGEGTRSKGKFQLKGYHPHGQLRVEGTYLDEGAKDGVWKYYFADGTLDSEEIYAKGKITGVQKYHREDGTLSRQDETYKREGNDYRSFTRYYRSGKVREQGQMKDETTEGALRRFNPDGTLISIEYYVDGAREGWQEYFDAHGKRVYAERLLNGALAERISCDEEGNAYERTLVTSGAFEMVTHYPKGAVMARLQLMNGYLHGKATWLYPDGSLEVEGGFLNGDRHGKWTYMHPNGKKRLEEEYHVGKLKGTSRKWFMDGTPESEFPYVDGERHGSGREFHMNGKIAFMREYAYGVPHGRLISYTHDGVPQMVRFYIKGELIAYGSPAADGSVKDTTALKPGVMELETRFPNGTISRKMTYRNGEIHGEFTEYHANGQLMEKSTQVCGEVEGISTEYHPNGKVHETMPYVDGYLHGERVIYWDNGLVRERINYVNGERHGAWTVHDRTGKVVARYRMRNDDVVEMGK